VNAVTQSQGDWSSEPWYEAWLAFNFLPSRILHDSWLPYFVPGQVDVLLRKTLEDAAWHRHCSAHILDTLAIARLPCIDVQARELQLAILPQFKFQRLLALAGAVTFASAIRRVIRRADVLVLQGYLQGEGLEFVRAWRDSHDVGESSHDSVNVAQLIPKMTETGLTTFRMAMTPLPAPAMQRVLLRLPRDISAADSPLTSPLDHTASLERLLALMPEVDPEWLSCFVMES